MGEPDVQELDDRPGDRHADFAFAVAFGAVGDLHAYGFGIEFVGIYNGF